MTFQNILLTLQRTVKRIGEAKGNSKREKERESDRKEGIGEREANRGGADIM